MTSQCASSVLMVRPAVFGSNPETQGSNAFQSTDKASAEDGVRVLREFDQTVQRLRAHNLNVWVVEDDGTSPDAIFPNNWFSTHDDGTLVLYPMLSPTRRGERDGPVLRLLKKAFDVTRTVDLTSHEEGGRFLEGTGSLVIDRPANVAYASVSPRTDKGLAVEWGDRMGIQVVPFCSVIDGMPVYHTNVVLSVGDGFAMVIEDASAVIRHVQARGLEVVALSERQVKAFAGNVLHVHNADGDPLIVLSETALASLSTAQRSVMEKHGALVPCELKTIERFGGGSVRCMLAEVFLTPRP